LRCCDKGDGERRGSSLTFLVGGAKEPSKPLKLLSVPKGSCSHMRFQCEGTWKGATGKMALKLHKKVLETDALVKCMLIHDQHAAGSTHVTLVTV
jgi:hypothetical protein